jgi:hypothetical protein
MESMLTSSCHRLHNTVYIKHPHIKLKELQKVDVEYQTKTKITQLEMTKFKPCNSAKLSTQLMVHCNDFSPDLEDVVLNMKLHNLCNPRNMEESLGHCTKLEYTQIRKNHIKFKNQIIITSIMAHLNIYFL